MPRSPDLGGEELGPLPMGDADLLLLARRAEGHVEGWGPGIVLCARGSGWDSNKGFSIRC